MPTRILSLTPTPPYSPVTHHSSFHCSALPVHLFGSLRHRRRNQVDSKPTLAVARGTDDFKARRFSGCEQRPCYLYQQDTAAVLGIIFHHGVTHFDLAV